MLGKKWWNLFLLLSLSLVKFYHKPQAEEPRLMYEEKMNRPAVDFSWKIDEVVKRSIYTMDSHSLLFDLALECRRTANLGHRNAREPRWSIALCMLIFIFTASGSWRRIFPKFERGVIFYGFTVPGWHWMPLTQISPNAVFMICIRLPLKSSLCSCYNWVSIISVSGIQSCYYEVINTQIGKFQFVGISIQNNAMRKLSCPTFSTFPHSMDNKCDKST